MSCWLQASLQGDWQDACRHGYQWDEWLDSVENGKDTIKFLIEILLQLTKGVAWNRRLMSICLHSYFPVTLKWHHVSVMAS